MHTALLKRLVIPITVDAVLIAAMYWLALVLRFEGAIPSSYVQNMGLAIGPILVVYCGFSYFFGLYHRLWRYASSLELTAILASVGAGSIVVLAADLFWVGSRPVPLSVVLTGSIFTLGAMAAVRYRSRLLSGFLWRWRAFTQGYGSRILIVGAGEEGQLLAWRLRSQASDYHIVGFVDDDQAKQGMNIHGAKVLGARRELEAIVRRESVDTIIIAIDKISAQDMQEIIGLGEDTSAKIKIAPDLFQLIGTDDGQPLIRDITVEDLLGRDSLLIDRESCQKLIRGKVVLVTGAAGSIGGELCNQIARFEPQLLLMLDNNESGLHDLKLDLEYASPQLSYKVFVGDILRTQRLEDIVANHNPHIIFHCAAYKHVPLMEENPTEAVLVNVQGTRNLLELAEKCGVERFVFVSTDKAVDPTGIMGVTKQLGEFLTICSPSNGNACFTVVRFGNVLNSRGSVVPIFQKQIDHGGPITITSDEMTRFFMGLSEAVSLIIQAASFTQGKDIFVLNMGHAMKIQDLARKLIRLRGLRIGEDIQIVQTGVRPGEKLTEELVAPHEEQMPTSHPYISRIVNHDKIDAEALKQYVCQLVLLAEQNQLASLQDMLFSKETKLQMARP